MQHTRIEVKDLTLKLPFGDLHLARGCLVAPAVVVALIVIMIGVFFTLRLLM